MNLIMCKGLPGSGKSTWAKQLSRNNQQYVRVNKDDIRQMIGYTPSRENFVLAIRDVFVIAGLNAGKHVIVDDTNFHPKHEKRLREIAEVYGAEFKIEYFTGVPLADCIKNDLKRAESVGEHVIRKIWREFLAPKPAERPVQLPGYPEAIICDLDGTLALHVDRSPYDTEKCDTDAPNYPIVNIVRDYAARGLHILLVSGRDEKYRDKTEAWLLKNRIIFHHLWMRPMDDKRRDDLIKQEIYDSHIRGQYNVEFVLDDRNRVVVLWRSLGLTCLQVADGEF